MAISIEQDMTNRQALIYLDESFSQNPLVIPSFPDMVAAISPHEQIPLFQAVRSAQLGFRRIVVLTNRLFPEPEQDGAHPLVQYRNFWREKAVMSYAPVVEITSDPPPLSAIPMVKATVDDGIYEYYHILAMHKNWVLKQAGRLYYNPNSVLKRWYGFDDVFDLCYMGLMRAAAQYDPAFNVTFMNFSATPMLGSVYDNLRVFGSIPRSVLDRIEVIEQQKIAFEQGYGRPPLPQELSELTGLTPQQMEITQEKYAMGRPQPLTAPYPQTETGDDRIQTPADMVAADQTHEPEWSYLQGEQRHELIQWVHKLPDRLQQVVLRYYGHNKSFKEISDQMGISESRVVQLNLRALGRLRSHYPDAKVPSREPLTIQPGFGEKLRRIRLSRHMSISELSRRLYGNRSTVGNISALELGRYNKSAERRIREIMRMLRLTPQEEQDLSALIK